MPLSRSQWPQKSNDRTETQTGNAEILEVHEFYCERDTPDMINQPQCCMNNKNYCWHKVLIRLWNSLESPNLHQPVLFRAYFGQELAIRTGRDLLTCKVTIYSLLCIEIVRRVSQTCLSECCDTGSLTHTRSCWHWPTEGEGGSPEMLISKHFGNSGAGYLSKRICFKARFSKMF